MKMPPRSNSFFFKQKTAYEIGLGIPAEPLFRSGGKSAADNHEYPFLYQRQTCHQVQPNRSEERRVGKECICRWMTYPANNLGNSAIQLLQALIHPVFLRRNWCITRHSTTP